MNRNILSRAREVGSPVKTTSRVSRKWGLQWKPPPEWADQTRQTNPLARQVDFKSYRYEIMEISTNMWN